MWTGILREITSPQLCQVISFMNHVLLFFLFPSVLVLDLSTFSYVHLRGHIKYCGSITP
jgi:hypothetical protein